MNNKTCMGDSLAYIFGGRGEAIQEYLEGAMEGDFSWWTRLSEWLEPHGVTYEIVYSADTLRRYLALGLILDFVIAVGNSPRGVRHAFVARVDGPMVYDPFDDRTEGDNGMIVEYYIAFEIIGE